jgi:hypothetical protein
MREEILEGPTVAVAALAGIGASHPGQGFPIAVHDRIDRQDDGGGASRLRTLDQRFGGLPPIGRIELKPDRGFSCGDRVFEVVATVDRICRWLPDFAARATASSPSG